jgi:hypothetical protein
MMQLKSVNNNIGIRLLFDVKQKESLLYSSEIQTAFEKNKDSHQNYVFVQERRRKRSFRESYFRYLCARRYFTTGFVRFRKRLTNS